MTAQATSSHTSPEITHGFADVNGLRLHYAETGAENDELVLLLHGFPEFWYSWRHQLNALGDKYHLVAPDLRGYNLSDKPARVEDYALDLLVKDVAGLIQYFGKRKAVVVGHDWGAGVAWATAQMRPEVVAKLVVMQVPPAACWRENITLRQFLKSWYMLFFQLPKLPEWLIKMRNYEGIDRTFRDRVIKKDAFSDEDVSRYKEAISRPGALTAAINYYRANVGRVMFRGGKTGRTEGRQRVPMPVLFIFGERDFAIIPETVRGVERHVAGPYKEFRLPDAGHWVQNEAATEVNKALREFLAT